MATRLDQILKALVENTPEWRSALPAESARLLERRLAGFTLEEIGREFGLTRAGVRHRLYGVGHGVLRKGGIMAVLRRLQ